MQSDNPSPYKSKQRVQHRPDLLLQFILSELFLVHAEMERIAALILVSPCSWLEVEPLTDPILKLVGSMQNSMRLFSWDEDGLLNKLKNYTALLLQASNREKEESELYQEANQAWLLALKAKEFLDAFHQEHIINIQALMVILGKLQRSIPKFTKLTAKILLKFCKDENVIFFILRYRESMEQLYGKGFVPKILRKMFGRRMLSVRDFLVERYSARGFAHLLPMINDQCEKL